MSIAQVAPEYMTAGEINLRLNALTDRITHERERTDERLNSLERLLDEKLDKMQAIMEKNLAQYESIANSMKAEISDIRGDVKALSAQVNTTQSKIGWYIGFLTIGVTLALGIFQYLMK